VSAQVWKGDSRNVVVSLCQNVTVRKARRNPIRPEIPDRLLETVKPKVGKPSHTLIGVAPVRERRNRTNTLLPHELPATTEIDIFRRHGSTRVAGTRAGELVENDNARLFGSGMFPPPLKILLAGERQVGLDEFVIESFRERSGESNGERRFPDAGRRALGVDNDTRTTGPGPVNAMQKVGRLSAVS